MGTGKMVEVAVRFLWQEVTEAPLSSSRHSLVVPLAQ